MAARPLPPPPTLDELTAAGPLALFLDFDGTLVEIASTPDSIAVPADLAARLAALSARFGGALALVSGRSIGDLERFLGAGLPIACAGSHGSEIRLADGSALGSAPVCVPETITAKMRDYAAAHELGLEEKPHGAALHYRSNPENGPAARDFAQSLAQEHGWIAQDGKSVVELVASQADKGQAVRALMETAPFAGKLPVFIGDDLTDEHGFAAGKELGGFGILVGKREPTEASHALSGVLHVHRWLGI